MESIEFKVTRTDMEAVLPSAHTIAQGLKRTISGRVFVEKSNEKKIVTITIEKPEEDASSIKGRIQRYFGSTDDYAVTQTS